MTSLALMALASAGTGIVIAIVYIVEKIISSRKKDPLQDIANLLSIVTKDIIEKVKLAINKK